MKTYNTSGETIKAGALVLREDNKILLVKNPEQQWSYPKGHIESDETKECAAKREVLEETGYEVEIIKQLSDVSYVNATTSEKIRVHMFLAKSIRKINEGESDIQSEWFSIEEARIKLFPNLTFLLKEI